MQEGDADGRGSQVLECLGFVIDGCGYQYEAKQREAISGEWSKES